MCILYYSVWKCVIDTENKFDFLYSNTDSKQRKDLVFGKLIIILLLSYILTCNHSYYL